MILVTGATGTVGSFLVAELAALDAPFRALTRSEAHATALRARGFHVVVGDFQDPESLRPAVEGVERIFLLSPIDARLVEYETNVLGVAREYGTPHVVKLSVIDADAASPCRCLRVHGESEEAVRRSALPFTFLRPGSFMQNWLGAPAATVRRDGLLYSNYGEAPVNHVDAADIGRAAAVVLLGIGHEGRTYTLTGPASVTMPDVAELLAERIGRPVRHVELSDVELRGALHAATLPLWLADGLVELGRYFRTGRAGVTTDAVRHLTGIPPASVAEFLARHREHFTP
jgi:uncharacterized protein YbjT (DUF2867 family)